jgi:hypothetical protein
MLTQKRLLELFHYEPETGFLYAKEPRRRCRPGNRIGTPNSHGYLQARVFFTTYPIHRLIWVMHHGPIPSGYFIDHVDRNKTNNRIDNLRCVTNQDNQRNTKKRCVNRSGFNGVRQYKGKWRAHIKLNQRGIHLGTFSTLEDAIAARKAAEQKLGFHPSHGLDLHTVGA